MFGDLLNFGAKSSSGKFDEDDSFEDEAVPEQVHVQFGHERIKSLYEEADEKKIDVCPFYQRDYVWNKRTRQDLITTLLYKRGYVPPLVLCERDGEPRTMIDGKQRLLTIVHFMRNNFPAVNGKYYSVHPRGLDRVLTQAERDTFQRIFIPCAVHRNLTQEQELATFYDLQKGVALTAGEHLHARTEKLVLLIKSLILKHPNVFVPKAKKARQPHFAHALQLAVGILDDGNFKLLERALSVWLSEYGNNLDQKQERVLSNVFGRMSKMSDSCPDLYKDLRPVELVALGYVLGQPFASGLKDKNICDVTRAIHEAFGDLALSSRGISHPSLKTLLRRYESKLGISIIKC